jgi:methylenetetrahydrofolate reductase (NADPH)
MDKPATSLQQRIASGKPLLLAEISPPRGANPAPVREAARQYKGKVHALGINDNRDRVSMAALAAATLVAAEGIEPILHVNTRDRNRIALVSEALGAQALGIRNMLCTSGSHQTLGRFRSAKNVYDIDSIQLLQTYDQLADGCAPLGEDGMGGDSAFCLGAVASPDADPLTWQVSRLLKKAAAGATFLVTQPIFDLERFDAWWEEVTRHGIHEKVAILAGIQPIGEEDLAAAREGVRRPFRVPDPVLARVASQSGAAERRAAAVALALETIKTLSGRRGLRGFAVSADGQNDTALEVIEKSGLGSQ